MHEASGISKVTCTGRKQGMALVSTDIFCNLPTSPKVGQNMPLSSPSGAAKLIYICFLYKPQNLWLKVDLSTLLNHLKQNVCNFSKSSGIKNSQFKLY